MSALTLQTLPLEGQMSILGKLDFSSVGRLGQTCYHFRVLSTDSSLYRKYAKQIQCPLQPGNGLEQIKAFINEVYVKAEKFDDYLIRALLTAPRTTDNIRLLHRYLKARDVITIWAVLAEKIQADGPKILVFESAETVIKQAEGFPAFFSRHKSELVTVFTTLNLSSMRLTHIPPEIFELVNLTGFRLDQNLLSELPREIGRLTNLTSLCLSKNCLKLIPDEIGNCSQLRELWLSFNRLSSLPSTMTQLNLLEKISLDENQFSSVPPEICLPSLKWLALSDNKLQSLPPEFANLTALKHLFLSKNAFTAIPRQVCSLLSLRTLDFDSNQIQALPPSFVNLTQLVWLYLAHNQLSELFPEIGNMQSLRELTLSSNKLKSLPSQITQLTPFWLDAKNNKLTSLPHTARQIGAIGVFSLGENPFSRATKTKILAAPICNLISECPVLAGLSFLGVTSLLFAAAYMGAHDWAADVTSRLFSSLFN